MKLRLKFSTEQEAINKLFRIIPAQTENRLLEISPAEFDSTGQLIKDAEFSMTQVEVIAERHEPKYYMFTPVTKLNVATGETTVITVAPGHTLEVPRFDQTEDFYAAIGLDDNADISDLVPYIIKTPLDSNIIWD